MKDFSPIICVNKYKVISLLTLFDSKTRFTDINRQIVSAKKQGVAVIYAVKGEIEFIFVQNLLRNVIFLPKYNGINILAPKINAWSRWSFLF